MRSGLLVLCVLLLSIGVSFGAGFGLYEFGARSSALGGAVVAQSHDASSVFYNPAGLVFQKGTQFYGGVALITASNRWVGPVTPSGTPIYGTDKVFDAEDQLHTPIGIYLTHSFNEKLAVGLGVTNPFGLGLKWGDDFPGRVVSKNVDLKSYYISPVVSYKLLPNLALGGGLDIVYSTVQLDRNILFAFPNDPSTEPGVEIGSLDLKGHSKVAFGFSASLLYKMDKLSLGFLYRNQVKNKFENGDATISLFNTPYKGFVQTTGLFVNQNASTEITYPSLLSAGVHYQLMEKLGVEVDYMWYKWDVFKVLDLTFDKAALNTEVLENYSNSSQFRVGVHYSMMDNLELRLGYIYDQTPQPRESMSPLLPDNTRNDLCVGLGYQMGKMSLDVGYMFVDFGERSTVVNGVGKNYDNFNGTYSSIANLFLVSYGISL